MNPKDDLIRAIDAYCAQTAQTSGTRAICDDLRALRDRVAKETNPVARSIEPKHGAMLDHAPMLAGQGVHIHIHS